MRVAFGTCRNRCWFGGYTGTVWILCFVETLMLVAQDTLFGEARVLRFRCLPEF